MLGDVQPYLRQAAVEVIHKLAKYGQSHQSEMNLFMQLHNRPSFWDNHHHYQQYGQSKWQYPKHHL
jgi:hypothetical protein